MGKPKGKKKKRENKITLLILVLDLLTSIVIAAEFFCPIRSCLVAPEGFGPSLIKPAVHQNSYLFFCHRNASSFAKKGP